MKTRSILNKLAPYTPGVKKKGAIKLSSNENPLGMSESVQKAIAEGISQIHTYPDGSGTELRTTLAALYGINKEQIILGNGSDEIFTFACSAYLNPGDQCISATETFSMYKYATLLFDGEYTSVPLSNGNFDLNAIIEQITAETKIIFLCNPNNPTGTYFSEEELIECLDKIRDDILVILDEAYYEYADADDYPDSIALLDEYPNLLITRTFSKIYGLAGLRLGYGIGNPDLITSLQKVRGPFNNNNLALIAGVKAIEDHDFTHKSIEVNREGKIQMYFGLRELNLEFYETQANFICINVKQDAKKVFEAMMAKGITIRPLNSFGLDSWIRITISTEDQNKKVLSVLKQILNK